MSDFKVTPETNLTTTQMMKRYNLEDEITLRRWGQLHGIDSSRGYYNPKEVDLIDHVHHHIYNLGMSITDYQSFIDRRQNQQQKFAMQEMTNMTEKSSYERINHPEEMIESTEKFVKNNINFPGNNSGNNSINNSVNNTTSEQINDEAYAAIEMLKTQYSEAIDVMGEIIADRFIDELDLSVMRHLAKKVKERQKLNGKVPSNRFLKTIKAVLQPQNGNFLVPRDNEDESSIELEQNHRLG